MNTIGLVAEAVFFADRLSRIRGLTDEETDRLQQLLAHLPAERPLRRWTDAQDAELRGLLGHGLTAGEIADRIGRSRDAIHTRVKRLKQQDRQGTRA